MNWIKKRLFPAKDHNKDDAIFRMILPSLLGIVLCGLCLAGTTWAWYSASTQSTVVPFRSANYSMEATVRADRGSVTQNQPNSFTLEANGSYTVILSATGNASTGYGKIQLSGGAFYTQPVPPGNTFRFTIETGTQSEKLTVIAAWGSHSEDPLTNDAVLRPAATHSTETEPTETQPTEPTETQPKETEPTPTETEPTPTETEPVPTETEPTPTETEPVPTETEPTPTETEPTPTETEPAPTETEPLPPPETEPTQPTQQPTAG